jgi:phosphoribosylaminoimidazole carboxylase PurE protein
VSVLEPLVAILMGSDSDLEVMSEGAKVLKDFGIPYEMKVLSAHRSPADVSRFAKQAKGRGLKVFICGAGGAAHLAGVVAAQTTLPVIGVPVNSSALGGLDALLATVQMPAGTPVATVAIGKAGARNAAILAAQMLALENSVLQKKLDAFKKSLVASTRKKNDHLKKQFTP